MIDLLFLSYYSKMLQIFMIIAEGGLRLPNKYNIRILNNALSCAEKVIAKLNDNQWTGVSQLFSKFLIELQKSNQPNKKR